MLNRIILSLLVSAFVMTALGCGQPASNSQSESPSTSTSQVERAPTPEAKLALDNSNWDLALNEAKGAQKAYLGSDVDIRGKVAQMVSTSDSESQFTIETTMEFTLGERTLIVVEANPQVTEDQWVRVQGELDGYQNAQNVFGAELRLPVVTAHEVSVITRAEVHPAIRTVSMEQSLTRHGLTITLKKVEMADSETRLYIQVQNDSPDKASLYAYEAVLVQGTQQIKKKDVFGEDLDEPDTTLVSGTTTEGILLFEAADPDSSPVKFIWEGPRTDDYSLTFDDWEWEISW